MSPRRTGADSRRMAADANTSQVTRNRLRLCVTALFGHDLAALLVDKALKTL